jgi:hypothetical protein
MSCGFAKITSTIKQFMKILNFFVHVFLRTAILATADGKECHYFRKCIFCIHIARQDLGCFNRRHNSYSAKI